MSRQNQPSVICMMRKRSKNNLYDAIVCGKLEDPRKR